MDIFFFFWGGGDGVITKLDYIYRSFLCILGSILKVMVQSIFGVAKISKYFFGVLEISDIFRVNGRCWARAYLCRKIESTPWGSNTVFLVLGLLPLLFLYKFQHSWQVRRSLFLKIMFIVRY